MMGECMNMFRTGWAQNVPVSYKFKSKERGNVEHIEYETIIAVNYPVSLIFCFPLMVIQFTTTSS